MDPVCGFFLQVVFATALAVIFNVLKVLKVFKDIKEEIIQ